MRINLNVANCWDWDYLNELIKLNDTVGQENDIQICYMYGSLPVFSPSARSVDRLPEFTGVGLKNLNAYISHAINKGIMIRYTLNQSCIGSMQQFESAWPGMHRSMQELMEMGVGEFTITSPLIMELMHSEFPDAVLEVSTICEVDSVEKLLRWNSIGADGVCLRLDINRDFPALGSIHSAAAILGMHVELLANEFCLYECAWRTECYNLSSHNSNREPFGFYPFRRCQEKRLSEPSEWIKSRFILPQWMELYCKKTRIDTFKITGRTHPPKVVLPIIEAYMRKHWAGNLLKLWPTISALGDTKEPADMIHINSAALDITGFLHYFERHGDKCRGTDCHMGCGHCMEAYRQASAWKETA